MSAEQTVTEAPVQQAPQATGDNGGFEFDSDGQRTQQGGGQSKSSRRRRRKRKGGTEAAGQGEQAGPGESSGASSEAPSGESQPGMSVNGSADGQSNGNVQAPRQNNQQGRSFQANGQATQQGQNAPGGTKRWKKKFRDRDRRGPEFAGQPNGGGQNHGSQNGFQAGGQQQNGGFRGPDTHQPGNNAFKRKSGAGGGGFGGGKQQRQRSGFVGPMDHSYRPVNGNVFDTSTIDQGHSSGGRRHSGDSQPIDYSQGRAIPIAADAPTRIYFFIEDLFFTAKIQETARKLGVKVAFIKNEKEQITALTAGEEADRPGLIVFDLNNANAKPLTLIPKLKTKLKKTTSIIGFLSHIQADLKAKAVEAGCDTVMPRAAFSQNLPNLLRRYGVEEAEETNFNQ